VTPWLGASLLVGGAAAGGIAGLTLAWYLRRHRGKAGVDWFMAALGVQSLWCGSYAVSLLVFDSTLRRLLEVGSLTAMSALGVVFLGFAFTYTGRSHLVEAWWYRGLFAVPLSTAFLGVTNGSHRLVWSGFDIDPFLGTATASYDIETWGAICIGVAILTVGVAVILLVDTVLSYGPLYRREAAAVALSTLPPAVALLVWAFDLGPVPQLNLAPALFVLHAGFDAYAFVGRGMFETNPTTQRAAERNATDDLQTPVLVLDPDDRVVRYNRATAQSFGYGDEMLGMPVADALDASLDSLRAEGTLALPVAPDRQFAASVSPLTDPRGEVVGRTVVLQDITQEQRRQQRLSVLNRVLRHNLRNEMTVVDGFADRIADRTDDERIEGWANTVGEAGSDLLSIGDTVRGFEQAGGDDPEPRCVDLGPFLASVAGDARDRYPDAEIELKTDLRDELSIETDPEVLQVVLGNLIENAVEHNPHDRPLVRLTATSTGRELSLAVTDDGPGIPEMELTPIRSGSESDLEHGSGVGLWVVRWGVEALGGQLHFDVTESGSRVEMVFEIERF
jgi:signal transduction histidine kinase